MKKSGNIKKKIQDLEIERILAMSDEELMMEAIWEYGSPANAQKAINDISLVQSASTGAHVAGRFSVPVLDKMNQLLKLNMNDDQFKGAEESIRDVMEGYSKAGGRHTVAQWKQDHAVYVKGQVVGYATPDGKGMVPAQ